MRLSATTMFITAATIVIGHSMEEVLHRRGKWSGTSKRSSQSLIRR